MVTAFARKYREDFFVRTEVNIIGLHVIYAVIILFLTVGSLIVLYHNTVNGITTALTTAATSSSTPFGPGGIMDTIRETRTQQIMGVSVLITLCTILFGYLVAKYALAPTKSALTTQKQFVGNIAHELRTPLSIIKTNIEVRLLDPDVPEVARKIHKSNLEELDRISDIINNLLTLNALVRPEKISFTNVDLGKVVYRIVDKLSYLVHRKGLRIRIKVAKERVVWGNVTALEQIAVNIIKNAVQHTASGEIVITIAQDSHGFIEFITRDTGDGIKREDLLHIFEPFYRGNSARTRTGGSGSGLGLAIVSELVRLHHGRVNIQSAPGHGTHVVVTVPPGENVSVNVKEEPSMNEVSANFLNREKKRKN